MRALRTFEIVLALGFQPGVALAQVPSNFTSSGVPAPLEPTSSGVPASSMRAPSGPLVSAEPASSSLGLAPATQAERRSAAPESTTVDPETRVPSRDVELHAGHVEIEGPLKQLRLTQGVEMTVHRYRVTADRLNLEHTAQGISVEGDGRVAFCPCEGPPLTIGFTRGTVAPPTDLLLRNSTFRACGVPILWLPAFWVRSPNKFGLLTPQLAWRGPDGPWFGSGVHLPIRGKSEASAGAVELLTGVYLRGGVDVGVQLRNATSRSLFRWDYVGQSFWVFDSSGYAPNDKKLSFSWSIDAVREARARTGAVSFERATRSHDRVRVELSWSNGRSLYGAGIQGDMRRATSLSELGGMGPTMRWAIGVPIGQFGRVDSSTQLVGRVREFDQSRLAAQHASELGFDARPGPAVARWTLHERWLVGSGSYRAFDAALLGTELRVGLPLVAEFGKQRSGAHWIEPFVLANAALRGLGAAYEARGVQPVSTFQVGLMNKLGGRADPNAISVQLRAGSVANQGGASYAFASRWIAAADWYALGGDIGWGGEDSWLSTARARIGKLDRISLRSKLEGRGNKEPSRVRWLLDEAWSPWQAGWLSRSGWLLGQDLDFMLGYQVAVSGGVAYDVVRDEFLSKRASASYRHPCGCLAVTSTVDWRVGRGGWDAWLAFDLMP